MCGRYASFTQAQDLADIFSIDVVNPAAGTIPPSWNVAPTDAGRIVRELAVRQGTVRVLDAARWGLVPAWATDTGSGARMINARSESAAERPAFRGALKYTRCVVPAEGYFEWQAAESPPGTKTPYFIHGDDGRPLALAGLYALWHDELLTYTILTRAARGELASLHDREPVVLRHLDVDLWLDPAVRDPAEALAVLESPRPQLAFRRVSTLVNAVRNNDPSLVEEDKGR